MKRKYIREPINNVDYVINYYTVLEIEENAPDFIASLKKQYKKLSKQHHPDLFEHASDQIKSKVKTKYQVIQEGYKILLNPESKAKFDEILNDFKANKPNLISTEGIPILSMSQEVFDLDFLLIDSEWDFQDSMKSHVAKLTQYNANVFDVIESQYLANPKDPNLKDAYMNQLVQKKTHLDMEEMFAWQDLGVLNPKETKFVTDKSCVQLIESKIEQLKNQTDKNIERRLLSIDTHPLLIDGRSDAITESTTDLIPVIKEKALKVIQERSEKLLTIAKNKDEHVQKMVKVRIYEELARVEGNSVQVMLYSNNKIMTCLYCIPDEEGNAPILINHEFDELDTIEVRAKYFDKTTYLLQLNNDVGAGYQIVDFIKDYYGNKLN
jgi:hypothetical protein